MIFFNSLLLHYPNIFPQEAEQWIPLASHIFAWGFPRHFLQQVNAFPLYFLSAAQGL